MTKGGLIMDVINAEQAKIAEEAGVSYPYFNRCCVTPFVFCSARHVP